MKTAYAYARFSSDNQREESIDAQLRAINEYCDMNDIRILRIFKDEAQSARTAKRPAFQELFGLIKENPSDYLIVHKLDRFARNRADAAFYRSKLKEAGMKLVSVLERLDDSPESIIMEGILESMNEYYSANLSRETKKGLKENRINTELVGAIVDFQTEETLKEIEILQLKETNKRLWLMNYLAIAVIVIILAVVFILYEKRKHHQQMKKADEKVEYLVEKLNESNVEKDKMAQEIEDFLKDTDKRQELETLTPHILQESGETKFRQCFELLYPLFLHRLRDKVPGVTRREEVLSMLIVLKQDNKKIAEYLAIAPRSVLMLRHRFRQKIGMDTEYSLENFIDDLLR